MARLCSRVLVIVLCALPAYAQSIFTYAGALSEDGRPALSTRLVSFLALLSVAANLSLAVFNIYRDIGIGAPYLLQ